MLKKYNKKEGGKQKKPNKSHSHVARVIFEDKEKPAQAPLPEEPFARQCFAGFTAPGMKTALRVYRPPAWKAEATVPAPAQRLPVFTLLSPVGGRLRLSGLGDSTREVEEQEQGRAGPGFCPRPEPWPRLLCDTCSAGQCCWG